ncbi:MAG: hypothetical protein ACM3JG_04530 [Thiohalocapsa sp.]
MLVSLGSRFRILVLLLTFALGLAGPVASTAAIAAQMQLMTSHDIGSGHGCPGCPGEQHGAAVAPCSAVGCWTVPALPAQNLIPEPLEQVVFAPLPELVIAGITSAPDPHPPRSSPHV